MSNEAIQHIQPVWFVRLAQGRQDHDKIDENDTFVPTPISLSFFIPPNIIREKRILLTYLSPWDCLKKFKGIGYMN